MICKAVVIGSSTGGTRALSLILPNLPADYSVPIVIVQHLHPRSDGYLSRFLNERCQVNVKLAESQERIEPGKVYIAPPNHHFLIRRGEFCRLTKTAKVNYARPSVDLLFESAAQIYREKLIGIILTGANGDGSKGLKRIKEFGGVTIVQNPKTAQVEEMPKAALNATTVDRILSLDRIGFLLSTLKRR